MLAGETSASQPQATRLRAGLVGLSSMMLVVVALSYSPVFRSSGPKELYAMIPGERDPYGRLGGQASTELSSYNHILSFNAEDSEVTTPKREDLEPIESQMKDSGWARRYLRTGQLFKGENAASRDTSGVDCYYTHPVEECDRRKAMASGSLAVAAAQDGDGSQDAEFDANCFYHHSVDFCMSLKNRAKATLRASPQALHDRPRSSADRSESRVEDSFDQKSDERAEEHVQERQQARRQEEQMRETQEREERERRAEAAERASRAERAEERPTESHNTGANIVEKDASDEESFESGNQQVPIEDVRHTVVSMPVRGSLRASEEPQSPQQMAKAEVHKAAMEKRFVEQARTARNFVPSAADHPGAWARSYTDQQVAWDLANGVTPIDASTSDKPRLQASESWSDSASRPGREMSLTTAWVPQKKMSARETHETQLAVNHLRKQALAEGYDIEPITGDGVGGMLRQQEQRSTQWEQMHGLNHNNRGDFANERHGLSEAAYLKPASESLHEGELNDGSWDARHGVMNFGGSDRQQQGLRDFTLSREPDRQQQPAIPKRPEGRVVQSIPEAPVAKAQKAQSRLAVKADAEASEIGSAGIQALGFSSVHRFEKHLEKDGV